MTTPTTSDVVYPSNRKEVVNRILTDFLSLIPETDPFLRNSYINAILTAIGGANYDLYKTVQVLQAQMFPDTATGEFATIWGTYKNIIRNPATQSSGYINITGTVGATIPIATTMQADNGIQFITQNDSVLSIAVNSQDIALTFSGGIVTASTGTNDHNLSTGNMVTISGATPTDYNGAYEIVVVDAHTFTYDITTSPSSPATGTPIYSINCVSCAVQSVQYGSNTNLESGGEVLFSALLPGVDSVAYIQTDGIVGGEDIESDADYRNRYIYAYQNPVSFFNVAEIVTTARKISGVTRVWVETITPEVGQVTIYFVRDNDTDIIPTHSEVLDVYNEILLKIKPAHVSPDDVIVRAPTPVPVDFVFTSLLPNTPTMQTAITANLRQMFVEVSNVSTTLVQDAYRSAIFQTIDPATGRFVQSFTLSEPTGDITITEGQLAILGHITFPS